MTNAKYAYKQFPYWTEMVGTTPMSNKNRHVHPEGESLVSSNSHQEVVTLIAWIVLFPWVGGVIGFSGYLTTAIILELSVIPHVDPPKYSYGQQSGLMSLPLASLIGFFAGIAFAGFVIGWRRSSSIAMMGVAILGTLFTFQLWYHNGMGQCNSEIVLYYPIFGLCTLIAIIGMMLVTITNWMKRKPTSG